jgi:hypothetical protein
MAVNIAHQPIPTACPILVDMPLVLPPAKVLLMTKARLGPGETAPKKQIIANCNQEKLSMYFGIIILGLGWLNSRLVTDHRKIVGRLELRDGCMLY